MTFHCVFQQNGVLFARANAFQAFCHIEVFKILEVFEYLSTDIVGFRLSSQFSPRSRSIARRLTELQRSKYRQC